MIAPCFTRSRGGRCSHEYWMMLAMMLVVCIALVRLVSPEQPPDSRTLWERLIASLWGLAQCFGLVIGASIVLASVEVLKQTAARYHVRRVENKLARLTPLIRDAGIDASPAALNRIVRLLNDGNETVRRKALAAVYVMLRANPALAQQPRLRPVLEEAVLAEPGFARALATTALDDPILERVTLGAKLGAGTADKRLAPVTSDPAELAGWVERQRRDDSPQEVQVSVGYDTGSLPWVGERSRFLALYLFIATTDLKRFQALLRRPPRDPNAAYGLVIRGDVVEVRYPGQGRGHRLDYVFPLPVRLSTANLAGLFREIQLLNLGLLTACAEDVYRVLLPGPPPTWLDNRRLALARAYRELERRLVALLRRFDRYRDPQAVHRLLPADHAERVRAFGLYRLEDCLYPPYGWVVPLYDPDTRWDRLLAPLRAVEGMLLHQGEVEGRDMTRGVEFIHQVRQLGWQTATTIDETLRATEVPTSVAGVPPDPFIDPAEEEATRDYLTRVGQAITRGETWMEELPDPATFRRATGYYEVELKEPANPRPFSPEVDP